MHHGQVVLQGLIEGAIDGDVLRHWRLTTDEPSLLLLRQTSAWNRVWTDAASTLPVRRLSHDNASLAILGRNLFILILQPYVIRWQTFEQLGIFLVFWLGFEAHFV